MRRFAIVLAVLLAGPVANAGPAAAGPADPPPAVAYRPPLDAEIVDTFRPPATPYGAGNRGIDYAAEAGQPVVAAAAGEVVFAGQVGGTRHVVVLHADGIRTSYSFLATTEVRRGQRVEQGDQVGTAGGVPVHFGARAGDDYVDPLILLGQRPGGRRAYLVADPDERRPLAESVERGLIVEMMRDGARYAIQAGGWLRDRAVDAVERRILVARVLIDSAIDRGIPLPVYLVGAALRWDDEQAFCTPASAPVPRPAGPPEGPRRVVVLVGGLGSSTGHASVLDVDTRALGYAAGDVHQYTYADDPAEPYEQGDTMGDIGAAGGRLARQITALQRANPDAVVDVIAHSEGGLVARSAITTHRAAPATLVTLATPHQGADLATAASGFGGSVSGDLVLGSVGAATGGGFDPTGTAVRQMSETSDFLRDLPEKGWPAATHVVSIAGRGDPIVPNPQARLGAPPAAYNAVVNIHGGARTDDHSRLPGSPEAAAEIARAIARQPPTCRSLPDTLLDEAIGRNHSAQEDLAGMALAVAGLYVDATAVAGAAAALR